MSCETRRLFRKLLDYMTVQVSEMFRDPTYFRSLREVVVPMLRTYPSIKVWVAGCSTGEEVYSLAILLKEEGLLARTLIYATDINTEALEKAEAGVYDVDRIAGFTQNHRGSGAHSSLSEHYTAAYGRAVFDKSLKNNIVFSDHSLATDSVFAEVQLCPAATSSSTSTASCRIGHWACSASRCAARASSASARRRPCAFPPMPTASTSWCVMIGSTARGARHEPRCDA